MTEIKVSTLAVVALTGISIITTTSVVHADNYSVSSSSGTYSNSPPPPPPPPPAHRPPAVAAVRG